MNEIYTSYKIKFLDINIFYITSYLYYRLYNKNFDKD